MNIYKILQKKRFGSELSADEIEFLVNGLASNSVKREQISAFLMAACINGLSQGETSTLTSAMTKSGHIFDFSSLGKPVIDKHSTGGVGDKISLLLVPVMISLDIAIPMISGRGLGHTGGTVDKMESILGYRTELTNDEIIEQMMKIGGMIVAQSENIAPADKVIYSIRDVTATVESDGLITASILSKKLAEGLTGLVLDLKIGNGAFYQTLESAAGLISKMQAVADSRGLQFKVIPSNMDNPLGQCVGNWLEVQESEECLKGNFPDDLKQLTLSLASEMTLMAGKAKTIDQARELVNNVLDNGEALNNFYLWIQSQGGDLAASRKAYENTPMYMVKSHRSGKILGFASKQVGFAAIELGAGRKTPDDVLDLSAGVKLLKKQGDEVCEGEGIAVLFARDTSLFEAAEKLLIEAIVFE